MDRMSQKKTRKEHEQEISLPAPQWPEPRPIAEAPKDGSKLLLWCPGLGWIISGWSHLYMWSARGYIPTHFLPLPPAPEARK